MFGLRFRENKIIECQNSRKSSPYEREVSCCYSIHILFENEEVLCFSAKGVQREGKSLCNPYDLNKMRMTGLEPARRRHQNLNLARLPIPPHPQDKQ